MSVATNCGRHTRAAMGIGTELRVLNVNLKFKFKMWAELEDAVTLREMT